MKLSSHLKTAKRNLLASRLRTFLAMLGIIVGTASVVALISGGQLATQQALEQIKGLGTDLMRVEMNANVQAPSNKDSKQQTAQPARIGMQPLILMQSSIPGILRVSPIAAAFLQVSYNQKTLDAVSIVGATENLADVIHIPIQSGRFINDLDKAQHFCVIGEEVAKKLTSLNPLSSHLKLGDQIYTIIGVADHWVVNDIVGQDINQAVIVPLPALLESSPNNTINAAILQLTQNADIGSVKQAVTDYFDHNFRGYRIQFQSSKELIDRINKQRATFSILLGLIGSISLLVGGIGVMNIMLASVAERHAEIGIRIALGAQPRDVQMMFLTEAATLAIIGGSIGVIIGIASTAVIASIAHWPFFVLFWPPFIGFSVSLIISLFFGFYPAYVASQLNPIEILTNR